MGYPVKQSQTAQPLLFLMIDSADHISPKTGLSPTVTISKNGGSFASPSGAVTEIANGWYKVAGNATDTNTLGPLLLHATASGADPTDDRFDVIAYDPQSSTNLGLSALPTAAPATTGGIRTVMQAGTVAAATATTVTLSSALTVDRIINGCALAIVAGTGIGQVRTILDYDGTTKIATVNRNWRTNPDTSSVYEIFGPETRPLPTLQSGTAQAGAATTLTLSSLAASVDNLYNGSLLQLTGGTGAGQIRAIVGYVGATRVATVDRAWAQTPDNTTVYAVYADDAVATDGTGNMTGSVASVTGAVGSVTGAVGSVTGNVGGNVAGSVASVTGNVGGNVAGSVGSVTAAVTVGTNNDKTGYSLTTLESLVAHSGTAQAGGATSVTLAAGASATTDFYKGALLKLYGGTGAGQVRTVTAYNGSTKVATLDRAWATNPDNTSTYAVLFVEMAALDASLQVAASAVNGNVTGSVASVTGNVGGNVVGSTGSVTGNVGGNVTGSVGSVLGNVGGNVAGSVGSVTAAVTVGTNNDKTGYSLTTLESLNLHSGTAQAGAATTITLAAGASATDDLYKGEIIKIYGGTGAGQARVITGYVGSTKVATVDRAWATNPDNTSTYGALALDLPKLNNSLETTAGSVTGTVTVGTNNDKTGYSLANNAVDAAQFTQAAADKVWSSGTRTLTAFSTALALSVWDVLEAAIATASSIGVKLKTGIPAIAPGTNGGLPTVDANNAVKVQSGTGANQISLSSGLVSLAAPDTAVANTGTATAGSSTTITLPAGASGTDQLYRGMLVKIVSGTGSGQSRSITDYTSRVATVDRAWTTNPDSTSVYAVVFADLPKVDSSGQVVASSVQGNVTGSVASVTGAVGSVTGNVGGNVVGSVGSVTNPVTVGTNNDKTGYALSAAGVQAIWDALTSALTTAGSIGKKLADWALGSDNRVLVSANAHTSGETVAAVAGAVGSVTAAVSLSAADSPAVNSGTATAGTGTTITLPAGASATDQLYRGMVVKITGGTGAGQARMITDYTSRVATVDRAWTTPPDNTSVYTVLYEDVPKVDASGQVIAASVQGNVTGSVASVAGNVGGNVTGSVGSLAAQAQTDVKSQVVAALTTDTYAEVASVPAATSSLKDKINWLFALARNKVTQTNTTQTLRNDSDTVSIATASASDDGSTYTRSKWS